MPVRVKGVPKDVTVSLQVGPAINGTALRDARGLHRVRPVPEPGRVRRRAATALNNKVKAKVLKGIDPADASRARRVTFLGAFTLVTPDVVTITPVRLEAA